MLRPFACALLLGVAALASDAARAQADAPTTMIVRNPGPKS